MGLFGRGFDSPRLQYVIYNHIVTCILGVFSSLGDVGGEAVFGGALVSKGLGTDLFFLPFSASARPLPATLKAPIVSESVKIQELSEFGLPYGVAQGLSCPGGQFP